MPDDDNLNSPNLHPNPHRHETPEDSPSIRISKAFGTFLLSAGFTAVVGLVIGAYQIAGVISIGLAHVLMVLAWAVAVFSVWLWLLSRPRKQGAKIVLLAALALGGALLIADRWMVWKKTSDAGSKLRVTRFEVYPYEEGKQVGANVYLINTGQNTLKARGYYKVMLSRRAPGSSDEQIQGEVWSFVKENITHVATEVPLPAGLNTWVTLLGPPLTAEDVSALQRGTNTEVYFAGFFTHSDENGEHETEFCAFVRERPQVVFLCRNHNGP